MAISATRPRADVAYCIHALARRLSKTHNWAVLLLFSAVVFVKSHSALKLLLMIFFFFSFKVALKTLIVIHRALREVDQTFHEEVINYSRSRTHMLNMSHFKDDSSPNGTTSVSVVESFALESKLFWFLLIFSFALKFFSMGLLCLGPFLCTILRGATRVFPCPQVRC